MPEFEPIWYIDGRMGENTLAKLLPNALEAIGVDVKSEKISAYSARKNLIQGGADKLVPGEFLSKIAGQKNLDSKLDYLRNKENTHKVAAIIINRSALGDAEGGDFRDVLNDLDANALKDRVNVKDKKMHKKKKVYS